MTQQPLLTSYHSDKLDLKNRIVLAPMTRARADNKGNVPNELMVEYYKQRATAGLLISEGVYVSTEAVGYINVPGIYTPEQVAGWKKVTGAVHAYGNKFFAQLWHVGRMSHPDMLNGKLPLAPSAINPNEKVYTPTGFLDTPTPVAMTIAQIKKTVEDFVQAAQNALAAGFDGVELHSANAYLFHQFFTGCSNVRTDEYGGSIQNRTRFLFEVLEAMQAAGLDLGQVGVRLNPSLNGPGGITLDADTIPTFDYIVERLNDYHLAYLHLLEPFTDPGDNKLGERHIARRYRPLYKGTLIINNNFNREKANQIIAGGGADLVAFGKPFIANPDLPARFAQNAPLAEADRETFYTPGSKGYTDYPPLTETKSK
jgi:N-ethylmaleimide reductase